MNIGVISVRDAAYPPNLRLRRAAASQGHRVTLIHPYRMWPGFKNQRPVLVGAAAPAPDVILPRQGATLGDTCLSLIRHFSLMGVPVINPMDAIRKAKDKFLSLQALQDKGLPVPDTILVNDPDGLSGAALSVGGFPVVVKTVSSRQGAGVVLVETPLQMQALSRDLNRRTGLLIQRFIPPEGRKDLRIVVVGKKTAGAAAFVPNPGDFRANYHLTGKSQAAEPDPSLLETALRAAEALDLEIAGVDLMLDAAQRPFVIEVNYSPGFEGIESATGKDIAGEIVRYAWHRFREKGCPRMPPVGP